MLLSEYKTVSDLEKDLSINLKEIEDSRLLGIIAAFEKNKINNSVYNSLSNEARNRGIDLRDKYSFFNKEKDEIPKRLKILLDDASDKSLTDRLNTTGMIDIEALFEKSNILKDEKLFHNPFIVFKDDGDYMNIRIVENYKELFNFHPDTKVMVQWIGNFSSNYFHFRVRDLTDYLEKRNEE